MRLAYIKFCLLLKGESALVWNTSLPSWYVCKFLYSSYELLWVRDVRKQKTVGIVPDNRKRNTLSSFVFLINRCVNQLCILNWFTWSVLPQQFSLHGLSQLRPNSTLPVLRYMTNFIKVIFLDYHFCRLLQK